MRTVARITGTHITLRYKAFSIPPLCWPEFFLKLDRCAVLGRMWHRCQWQRNFVHFRRSRSVDLLTLIDFTCWISSDRNGGTGGGTGRSIFSEPEHPLPSRTRKPTVLRHARSIQERTAHLPIRSGHHTLRARRGVCEDHRHSPGEEGIPGGDLPRRVHRRPRLVPARWRAREEWCGNPGRVLPGARDLWVPPV